LNYTIGGAAITKGGLTKQGSASLTLTGNNTFTNNSTLQGGTVYLGADGALGAGQVSLSGSTVSSDGATARSVTNALLVTADTTFGDGGAGTGNLTFSGPVNWGGGTRVLVANVDVLMSGGSSNGLMNKAGSNTITLEGIHNMAGSFFNILNGTLRLNGAWMTNNSSNLRVTVNQTNGTARLIIDGGGFVCTNSGTELRLGYNAFGNSTQGGLDSGATNILDVNGLLELSGGGGITMGRSAAWSELNLLTNGHMRVGYIHDSNISGNRCPAQVNFNGGTLEATTSSTSFVSGVDANFFVHILAGGVTIDSAGFDLTIPEALQQGPMGSTGGLTKIGNGTLTLSGANTYTGATVVNQGKLVISTASTGGGAITVNNGASLGITVATQGASLPASDATLGTTATHDGMLDINLGVYSLDSYNAPLNLTGNLSASGTNTINITATNGLYLGQYPLIKYAGSLAPGAFGAFKLGTLPPNTGGVLVNNTANRSIDLHVTSGLQAPLLWSGIVNNFWDINGTSNWINNVDYSQSVYRELGGIGPAVTFDDNALSYTVNILTPVSPSSVTVSAFFNDYTIGGLPIAGAGKLTKSGTGALVLTSSNSYSGGTTVSQGTVQLGASGALGSGLLTLSGGLLTSDSVTPRTNLLAGVSITTGTILGDTVNTGRLNLGGTVNWNNGTRALTINSDVVLSGGSTNGSFSKTGPGVLTLQGSHYFSRLVDVFLGDLVLDGVAATSTAGNNIRVNCNVAYSQARLVLTNGASFVNTVGSPLYVGLSGADTTSTNILDLAGRLATSPGAVAYLGASCALGEVNLLSGGVLEVGGVQPGNDPSFNGESRLNFNGGALRANANSTTFLTGLSNVFVLNGGAIIDSSNYSITVTQPLLSGGSGGLTKIGTGTLTLNGVNTYTNTTLVSAGTLAGTGTIAGPVSVAASGTLAPGNGIGTLTINNTLSLAGSVLAEVSLDGAVTNNDRVSGLVSVAYGGTLVITNVGATPLTAGVQFPLFSAAAPGTGNFSSIIVLPDAGLTGTFDAASGIVTLVNAAVPPTLTYRNLGDSLEFSWAGGGTLQVQTNALSVGLKPAETNWVDYPGGSPVTVPIIKTNPTVFFRVKQ
jgi:autotransporter-associated beta strand protein